MWLTVEEPQLRPVIDEAIDTVQRVSQEAFWAAARSGVHSVETPFLVMDPARRVTSGVVDLLFESAAGWTVVDYKTDMTLDSSAYEAQLDSYRAALQEVGCTVARATVIGVRSQP
jgi:ATP-dependent exoDNAse (exonuclease V) beta subunit